ncbi:MAG: hypothetical protein ACLU9X_13365 [Alistipes shahii]
MQFSREAKQTIRTQANRQDKGSKKTFRATVGPFILAERLRLRMPTAKGQNYGFPTRGIAAFWWQKVANTVFDCCSLPLLVGKKRRKNRPADKKAERRGLTLAPGDYSRVCKQTVPSARAFSPPLS